MRNQTTTTTNSTQKVVLNTDDMAALGIEGVYKVEKVQSQEFDGKKEKFYVLKRLFSMPNALLYIPVKRSAQRKLRPISTKREYKKATRKMLVILGDNLAVASSKKLIEICTQEINDKNFQGLMNALLTLKTYMETTDTVEKEISQFSLRVESAITQEIAAIENFTLTISQEKLTVIINKFLF